MLLLCFVDDSPDNYVSLTYQRHLAIRHDMPDGGMQVRIFTGLEDATTVGAPDDYPRIRITRRIVTIVNVETPRSGESVHAVHATTSRHVGP